MSDLFYYLVITNVFWAFVFAMLGGMTIVISIITGLGVYNFLSGIKEGELNPEFTKKEWKIFGLKVLALLILGAIAISIIF